MSIFERASASQPAVRLQPYKHPCQRLPFEVLRHLFGHIVDATRAVDAAVWPRTTATYRAWERAPFIVAAVCKQWRELALDHSALWRHLVVDFACVSGSRMRQEREREHVLLLLKRSRSTPLDIFLLGVPDQWTPSFQSIVAELVTHHNRVQRLELAVDGFDEHVSVTQYFRTVMPALVEFAVSNDAGDMELLGRSVHLPNAPGLVACSVHKMSVVTPVDNLLNMRHLMLQSYIGTASELWKLLHTLPYIETLTLHCEDDHGLTRPPYQLEQLVLPALRELTMRERHASSMFLLLASDDPALLNAPALTSLTMIRMRGEAFDTLLHAWCDAVTTLTLEEVGADHTLASALVALQSLQALTLQRECYVHDTFFPALALAARDLPALAALRLLRVYYSDAAGEAFAEFVERDGAAQLAVVEFDEALDQEYAARIEEAMKVAQDAMQAAQHEWDDDEAMSMRTAWDPDTSWDASAEWNAPHAAVCVAEDEWDGECGAFSDDEYDDDGGTARDDSSPLFRP